MVKIIEVIVVIIYKQNKQYFVTLCGDQGRGARVITRGTIEQKHSE